MSARYVTRWWRWIGHIQLPARLLLQQCLYLAPFSRYGHLFRKSIMTLKLQYTHPLRRVIYHALTSLVLLTINQHTKFDVSIFTNSQDMIRAPK